MIITITLLSPITWPRSRLIPPPYPFELFVAPATPAVPTRTLTAATIKPITSLLGMVRFCDSDWVDVLLIFLAFLSRLRYYTLSMLAAKIFRVKLSMVYCCHFYFLHRTPFFPLESTEPLRRQTRQSYRRQNSVPRPNCLARCLAARFRE